MKFSIIVPVYNVEAYVEEALNSLLAQDYSDYEVILVDDGSTDRSSEICQDFARKDERFKYFRQENQGQSVARNYGILKASGELIYFFDSDDLLVSNALNDLSHCFLDQKIDVVFFEASVIGVDNSFAPVYERDRYQVENETANSFISRSLVNKTYFVSPCCYVFRRSVLGDVRFKPAIIHEDELFYFQMFALSASFCIKRNEKYFIRRVRPNSTMTAGSHKKHSEGYLQVINGIINELKGKKVNEELYLVFCDIYSSLIYNMVMSSGNFFLGLEDRYAIIRIYFKLLCFNVLGFKSTVLSFFPEFLLVKLKIKAFIFK